MAGFVPLPRWGRRPLNKSPRMGEVIYSWNGDGVFTGRESYNSHKNKMKPFKTYGGFISAICATATTLLVGTIAINLYFYDHHYHYYRVFLQKAYKQHTACIHRSLNFKYLEGRKHMELSDEELDHLISLAVDQCIYFEDVSLE